MECTGRVVRLKGGLAEVDISRTSACGGDCGKCAGCPSTVVTIDAVNEVNAGIGQVVEVDSPERNMLLAAAIIYAVPLLLLIATYIAVYSCISSRSVSSSAELIGLMAGIIVLMIYFLTLRFVDRRLMKKSRFKMRITRIIKEN